MSSRHLDDAALRAAAAGTLDAERSAHVSHCPDCRVEADVLRLVAASVPLRSAGECPEAEDLVRHAEGVGNAAWRVQVDDHVTSCVACAADVEAMGRARSRAGAPPAAPQAMDRVSAFATALRELVLGCPSPLPAVLAVRGDADGASASRLASAAARVEGGDGEGAEPALRALVAGRFATGESRWWLARALLLQGRSDDALAELGRVARARGDRAEEARELTRRVRQLVG